MLLLAPYCHVGAADSVPTVTRLRHACDTRLRHAPATPFRARPAWMLQGYAEISRLLLMRGAEPSQAKTDTGSTALMWATLYGNFSTLVSTISRTFPTRAVCCALLPC